MSLITTSHKLRMASNMRQPVLLLLFLAVVCSASRILEDHADSASGPHLQSVQSTTAAVTAARRFGLHLLQAPASPGNNSTSPAPPAPLVESKWSNQTLAVAYKAVTQGVYNDMPGINVTKFKQTGVSPKPGPSSRSDRNSPSPSPSPSRSPTPPKSEAGASQASPTPGVNGSGTSPQPTSPSPAPPAPGNTSGGNQTGAGQSPSPAPTVQAPQAAPPAHNNSNLTLAEKLSEHANTTGKWLNPVTGLVAVLEWVNSTLQGNITGNTTGNLTAIPKVKVPSRPPSPSAPSPSPVDSPTPSPPPQVPSPSPSPPLNVTPPSPSPRQPSASPSSSPSPSPSPSPAPSPPPNNTFKNPVVPTSPQLSPSPSPPPQPPLPSPAPSPSPEPFSPAPSPSLSPEPVRPDPPHPGPEPAVIAGAVVASAVGLALLAGLAGLIAYRRRRKYSKAPRNCLDKMLCLPEPEPRTLPILSSKDSSTLPDDGGMTPPGISRSSSMQHVKNRKGGASPINAPASDIVMAPDVIVPGGGLTSLAMSQGFTGDELKGAISDLKYVVTNVLLPAVLKEGKPFAADPLMAWLDFGMDRVRTDGGSSVRNYTASDTFVEDWRTHRIWDWLNHHFWRHVPTDRRMVHVESVPGSVPQKQYARHILSNVQQDWHYQPFASAVDSAVDILISTAVATAASTAIAAAAGNTGNHITYSQSGGNYPDVQGVRGGSGEAADADLYYRPVLRQLCEAGLKLHLQVQGTADGMFIYVPGATDAVGIAVPPAGMVSKIRRGGSMQCCLCERPGILRADQHAGILPEVWLAAYAVKIVFA